MQSAEMGDVDRIVRLHHRRRGWAWVGFGSLIGLVTALVDTVRLRGFGAEARRTARENVEHHPVYAHAHRYPPRHHVSWVAALFMLLTMTAIMVIILPEEVNSVAYVAGAESHDTFNPLNYAQDCGRGGCTTVTQGYLS